MRSDLARYTGVIAKSISLAEDRANILIENGWLEQPPQAAVERKQLTRV
ncbi:DUF3231 family protein [Paenibacillus cremeus]|uniref:DUF3231 family protein n=2 Tax=Paenibacillus cremeus TaxID=2163881 RepID=A0A559KDZ2_9BACL|nr:DUF3231 family protein [Paenibacillus cremeus]